MARPFTGQRPRGAIVDKSGNLTRSGLAYMSQIEGDFAGKLDEGSTALLEFIWPIGCIFSSTRPDPPTYGAWTRVEGVFLVGQKNGDADFGTAGTTGGARTHKHIIDPPSVTTGAPSASATVQSGAGAAVAATGHTHTANIAAFDSDTVSHLPPWKAVYIWERTA